MQHASLRISLSILIALLFLFMPLNATEQTTLRFPVWVLLEPYPGAPPPADLSTVLPPSKTGDGIHPAQRLLAPQMAQLKELSVFLLEGMLFGWNFSYTPQDSRRGVKEYFSFEPITSLSPADSRLVYTDFLIQDSRLSCWVEFERSDDLLRRAKQWSSITYPKISGSGKGSISDGVTGITNAYKEAVLQAVRNYARSIEKNKPKEINGSVLLTDFPRLYIKSGNYVADIILFLSLSKIVPYTLF